VTIRVTHKEALDHSGFLKRGRFISLGQYGGKLAYFSTKTILNGNLLLCYVVVEKPQSGQSAGAQNERLFHLEVR
jgi:hypothetical protein